MILTNHMSNCIEARKSKAGLQKSQKPTYPSWPSRIYAQESVNLETLQENENDVLIQNGR